MYPYTHIYKNPKSPLPTVTCYFPRAARVSAVTGPQKVTVTSQKTVLPVVTALVVLDLDAKVIIEALNVTFDLGKLAGLDLVTGFEEISH